MTTKLIVLLCLLAVSQARFANIKRPLVGGRIIGGVDAQPGEFPHIVSLQYGIPPIIKYNHFCAGSIINERWILTTGFCKQMIDIFGIYSIVVRAGKHALNVTEPTEQESHAEAFFINKNYYSILEQPIPPTDEVILIKLRNPLRFNEHVSPISLAAKGSEPTGKVIMSGWGAVVYDKTDLDNSNILQKASLDIIDHETCRKAVVDFGKEVGKEYKEDLVGETNVCTGPLTGGVSPCSSGDYGGPLISKDKDGKIELVAVASWLTPCGRKGAAVYVKVASIIDWIQNIISEN